MATPASEAAKMEDMGEGQMVDLSGVDENASYPVMPSGMYNAIIDDVSYGLSQRSGNPMWTIVWELEDGDYKGRKLFFHLPFTENMMGRVKRTLSRIGASEVLAGPFNPRQVAESGILLGKRAKLRVDVRKYEGADRNNVRDVLPSDASDGGDFLAA